MKTRVLATIAGAVGLLTVVYADVTPADRLSAIKRAQVWMPRDVAAYDFMAGDGEFAPGVTINCSFLDKKYNGKTPKFGCLLAPGDDAKIKYGNDNSEVFAGVAATRLLRALGFGVDMLYPVTVDCHDCPSRLGGTPAGDGVSHFAFAALERKMKGKDVKAGPEEGWRWAELDLVDPSAGGAPRAHRDALKLLAVFLQHTDNKSEQQRLLCLPTDPDPAAPPCARPFMMIHDVGNVFGKANKLNRASVSGANLKNWTETPIWKDAAQCVGHLSKSFTGNLSDPRISEEGRQFLSGLLTQLTDTQLHDLFTVARFAEGGPERMHAPADSNVNTIDAWVHAFKQRRAEIANAHCHS